MSPSTEFFARVRASHVSIGAPLPFTRIILQFSMSSVASTRKNGNSQQESNFKPRKRGRTPRKNTRFLQCGCGWLIAASPQCTQWFVATFHLKFSDLYRFLWGKLAGSVEYDKCGIRVVPLTPLRRNFQLDHITMLA